MACGELVIGSSVDCENIPAMGTRARAILFNYNDIEGYTEENGIITNINLLPGKYAYDFLGFKNSFQKSEDFVRTKTKRGRFKHNNSILISEWVQTQKNNIQKIANGRFVAALFNMGADNDSIELSGRNVGLKLNSSEIRNAYANDAFFTLNLSSPNNTDENEPSLMQTIFLNTRQQTIDMLEGLLPPVDLATVWQWYSGEVVQWHSGAYVELE